MSTASRASATCLQLKGSRQSADAVPSLPTKGRTENHARSLQNKFIEATFREATEPRSESMTKHSCCLEDPLLSRDLFLESFTLFLYLSVAFRPPCIG